MTFAFFMNFLYIFEIIIGISFIIFIHELGHFLTAKWRGVRCETFSFGFGPKIIRWLPKYPWKPKDPNFKYKDVITEDMLESPEDLDWLVRTKRLRLRKYDISKVTAGMVAAKLEKNEDNDDKLEAELLTDEKIAELREKGEKKILIYDASETEYAASLFWLGGYVKMAGEFESDKKKRELKDEFLNKDAGSRAMVIVAGVTFNAISAFILFIIAFGMGVPSVYPGVGGIQPLMTSNGVEIETPAWKSGLKPGDKILKINGGNITEFTDLQVEVAFSDEDEEIELEVQRPGFDKLLKFTMKPEYNDSLGFASIGLEPVTSTRVGKIMKERKDSLKGTIKIKGQNDKPGELREGDVIIGVKDMSIQSVNYVGDPIKEITEVKPNEQENLENPRIRSYASLREILNKVKGDKVTLKINRNGKIFDIQGIALFNRYAGVSFGLDMYPNVPIKSVKEGGPADIAKIAVLQDGEWIEGASAPILAGDKIIEVNGIEPTSFEMLRRAIRKLIPGEKTVIKVMRNAGDTENQKIESLFVIPTADTTTGSAQLEFLPDLDDTEKYNMDLTVKGVNPNAKFQILSTIGDITAEERKNINHRILTGDRIIEVKKTQVTCWNRKKGIKEENITVISQIALNSWKNNKNTSEIPECDTVEIKVIRTITGTDGKKKDVTITYNTSAFAPDIYVYKNLIGFSPMQGYIDIEYPFGEAIVMGMQKTWVFAKMVVMTIKSVISSRISSKNIGGPILIAQASYKVAKLGLGKFIYFMALLSINLAILNILPIPVFDGGALLFIFVEKIRGRKLSDRVLGYFNAAGLVIIGLLIILVLYNDISRLFS